MSTPAAPHQTISFLLARFREVGIEPDARRGQNFLIDLNLQQLLVRTADPGPNDVLLEIGTGTGSLTALMAAQAAAVVSVEVDQHLHQLARELLVDFSNVRLLHQDALKNKNHFAPEVLDAVREVLAAGPDRRLKLAANLPFCVATPVLSNLLAGEPTPVTMTATIQKELADRIVAGPGSKDYGGLSIWIQSQCDVELVRVLPPSVFWPKPRVQSAIIQVRVDPERRAQIPDLTYFHNFVRAMFIHRRKFLRSNLVGAMKRHLDKPGVDAVMNALDLSADARAEQLDVDTMLALAEKVRQAAPDWTL